MIQRNTKIIAKVEDEELELYVMDKYRAYTNSSNKDKYLCRDTKNKAHTIDPTDIIRFV